MFISRTIFAVLLSSLSLTTFAEGVTCELNRWCQLPRASDYADITIYANEGQNYTCTLSVNGQYNKNKLVDIVLYGHQGFETEHIIVSGVHQGGSKQVLINGIFTDPNGDPVIRARRLPNDGSSATNELAMVMCELGPSAQK